MARNRGSRKLTISAARIVVSGEGNMQRLTFEERQKKKEESMSFDYYYAMVDGEWARFNMRVVDGHWEYIPDDEVPDFSTDFWIDICHGGGSLTDERFYFDDFPFRHRFLLGGLEGVATLGPRRQGDGPRPQGTVLAGTPGPRAVHTRRYTGTRGRASPPGSSRKSREGRRAQSRRPRNSPITRRLLLQRPGYHRLRR
jgi:hypothetical protein